MWVGYVFFFFSDLVRTLAPSGSIWVEIMTWGCRRQWELGKHCNLFSVNKQDSNRLTKGFCIVCIVAEAFHTADMSLSCLLAERSLATFPRPTLMRNTWHRSRSHRVLSKRSQSERFVSYRHWKKNSRLEKKKTTNGQVTSCPPEHYSSVWFFSTRVHKWQCSIAQAESDTSARNEQQSSLKARVPS